MAIDLLISRQTSLNVKFRKLPSPQIPPPKERDFESCSLLPGGATVYTQISRLVIAEIFAPSILGDLGG